MAVPVTRSVQQGGHSQGQRGAGLPAWAVRDISPETRGSPVGDGGTAARVGTGGLWNVLFVCSSLSLIARAVPCRFAAQGPVWEQGGSDKNSVSSQWMK